MNNFIDIYCERLGPGLLAEPLNAISNIAFFIAAFFAYRLACKENQTDWKSLTLIGLITIIGIGSTLFHTLATAWAQMADVLPILFYQIAFIILYTRYVIGLNCWKSGAILAGFFATIYVIGLAPQDTLNGSLGYAPALIFVLGFGVWHLITKQRERFTLLAAGGIFIISLTFRSLDMAVCESLPIGLHYFWHSLNGVVLYLSTRAYILNAKKN